MYGICESETDENNEHQPSYFLRLVRYGNAISRIRNAAISIVGQNILIWYALRHGVYYGFHGHAAHRRPTSRVYRFSNIERNSASIRSVFLEIERKV